ncbi:MAG: alpha/beta hydrolase fold domain-containing protein [Treponema sp.]|nr:alpha/beta hydrolase fold domain-containing protein [Candidatus Treponema equi]
MEIRLDKKTAIKKIKSLVLSSKSEVEVFRTKLEKNFKTDFLPNRVERIEKSYFGVKCDLLVPEVLSSSRVVVYIHGGSFVGGSRDSWRSFCSSLAHAVSSKVIVPEFRLAPLYQYPAAIEDLECVLRGIMGEANAAAMSDENSAAPEIILAADGSGASLAYALIFRMTEEKRKSISKLILFSPWLDLSYDNPVFSIKKSKDKVLNSKDIRYAADQYTNSANLSLADVSPLRASEKDFVNFPDVFIQCGENEILMNQVENMNDLLTCYGIDCTLDVVPEMFYMFQMAGESLLESSFAIERAGKYVNKRADLTDKELKERERLMKENNIARE